VRAADEHGAWVLKPAPGAIPGEEN